MRHIGEVIWFSDKLGIGFLQTDCNSGKDLFVHYSHIKKEGFKSLNKGDKVAFTLGANDNGPQAEEIVVTEECKTQDESTNKNKRVDTGR